MEVKKGKRKVARERWITILAIVIGLFAFNLFSAHHFKRVDLTERQNYTLADATKKMLGQLEDVVTVRLYFSEELPPALQNLKKDVEDMLEEFKTYSKNKINIEFLNPQKNQVEEQKVQMTGIPPVEVTVLKKDKQELARIYLGATVNFASKQEILAVIQNTSNLEYRLAAAIWGVTRKKQSAIGWWAPGQENLPQEVREQKGFSLIQERLQRRFKITPISEKNLDVLHPEETPTIVLFPAEKMEKEALEALEKYLEEGGNAVVLMSRVGVGTDPGQGLAAALYQNPLEPLLGKYGVTLEPELVLDRSNASATFIGGVVNYHIPYPYWVRIRPENFNRKEPMVSELSSLVLPWVDPIQIKKPLPEGVEVVSLFQSTEQAVAAPVQEGIPLDPQQANNALHSGTQGQVPLGVMVHKEGSEGKEGRMILVGNAAFVTNGFLQQFEENAVFLENALDVLGSAETLVGIRSKGIIRAPLEPLSDSERFWIKTITLVTSPILLLGLGFFVFWGRRKKAKYLKALYVGTV